jgi:hypothetical protein
LIFLKFHKENIGEVDNYISEYLQTYYIQSFSSTIRREFNLLIEYFPHLRDSSWRKIIVGYLSSISSEGSISIYWENCFKCLQKIRQNQHSLKIIEDIPLLVVNQIIETISVRQFTTTILHCYYYYYYYYALKRIYSLKCINSYIPIMFSIFHSSISKTRRIRTYFDIRH